LADAIATGFDNGQSPNQHLRLYARNERSEDIANLRSGKGGRHAQNYDPGMCP
jgi:hypothetical protein